MYIIFIYGPMASGKYTIAKKLSEELDVRLFHNHLGHSTNQNTQYGRKLLQEVCI